MRTRDTQFKHTLLSNSSHIIYDGMSSRMFGIRNVQPTNGLAEEIFLANTNLVTDQSRYSDKVYLLGVQREPLEFTMRLFFDPHTFDERKFQEMKRWFRQDTYKPFRYDSGKERDLDIWVYAIYSGQSKAFHNAIDDGYIDFTFRTNAPHRFSQVMEDEFDFTQTNTNKMEEQVKEGLTTLEINTDKLNSRLRQAIRRPEEITNSYLTEYYNLISPLVNSVKNSLSEVNKVFTEYKKVKGVTSVYPDRWDIERVKILNNINKAISNTPSQVSTSYSRATLNMFAYSQVYDNTRITLSGGEVYDTKYITSEWIRVKPDTTYIWKAHEGSLTSPRIVFYASNLDYIKTSEYKTGQTVTFTTDKDVGFIQISANKSNKNQWKLERGSKPTSYTANPVDRFFTLREENILTTVEVNEEALDSIFSNINNFNVYINTIEERINNTLGIYPNIVSLYNFGDLPCKPVIQLTVQEPVDIRIENLDTKQSTTITDNMKGEVITLLNETEEIETSRTKAIGGYYKYDSHDDNFITLSQYENQLQFYGSYKVKITYQFKLL